MRIKPDIKIIFIDIDWTILSHKDGRHFDMKSIKALRKAQQNGVKVVLCTARAYHSVHQTGLFYYFRPDGFIVCNGGMISLDHKTIYKSPISNDKFLKLCDLVSEYHLTMECVEPFSCFLLNPETPEVSKVYSIFHEDMPPIKDYHNKEIISCLLFMNKSLDEEFVPKLPEGLSFYRFCDDGGDLVEHHHLKGEGVKIALEYLNIDKSHAMAIGDDLGDISMFKEVKYSVAMKNGKEETKESAFYVTKEVWNSGVKHALKYFHVI